MEISFELTNTNNYFIENSIKLNKLDLLIQIIILLQNIKIFVNFENIEIKIFLRRINYI